MSELEIGRRGFLAAAGAGVIAATVLPKGAAATPQEADDFAKKLIGNAVPKEGKVQLKLKDVAESGANEPVSVVVDSPMTAADHVKAIHVIADGNPNPGVSSWHLTPRSGKAEVSFRMRLGKTQTVRAYAVMSDGSVYMAKQEIKVTIGGC
ncbi:MAG TPA: thiosulfate oxidation carrier protein SoxY [Candidatus Omnitrophota bacterium]|nr:thiosulfate oxidation carrier protein SoxY [Candidatus Omnitrophota bacterium]